MATKPTPRFSIGDQIVDRDGFHGSIESICWNGSQYWYNVRFSRGGAVRFEYDLTLA